MNSSQLLAYNRPSYFPLEALPGPFREIGQSFALSGIDSAIIGPVMLGVISLLTQGIADARWPNGQPRRTGVSALVVSPSGSGKSLVLNTMMAPLTRIIEKISSKTFNEEMDPMFFVEDATREALISHLVDWPVATLCSDEAGQLTQLLRHGAPALAKLLDGAPLHHARISTGRIALRDHRLSMLLLLQPTVFESIKPAFSSGTGSVGLGNRFIWAQGSKVHPCGSTHSARLTGGAEIAYLDLAERLITRTIEMVHRKRTRPELKLTPSASRYLSAIAITPRNPHRLRSPTPPHEDEYLTRHSERVLSLAAAFHVIDSDVIGEISLHHVEAAVAIDQWSIQSHALMNFTPPKLSQAERDAAVLEAKLIQAVQTTGYTAFSLVDMRRCATNIGLTRGRLDRAIAELGAKQKVFIRTIGSKDLLCINFSNLLAAQNILQYGAAINI